MFWSVFGRGEASVVKVNGYENHVTEDFGYVIYGLFNVALVTVLLNMLIAMMARSYQAITVSKVKKSKVQIQHNITLDPIKNL